MSYKLGPRYSVLLQSFQASNDSVESIGKNLSAQWLETCVEHSIEGQRFLQCDGSTGCNGRVNKVSTVRWTEENTLAQDESSRTGSICLLTHSRNGDKGSILDRRHSP